jgi:GNAT superfamily N-acetyltransferase
MGTRLARSVRDFDACVVMQMECLPEDEPLEAHEGTWWVTENAEGYTGFAACRPSSRWADTLYLSRAGVLPSARGQGLQRDLIRVRLAYARRKGLTWAISDTCDGPTSSNNLIACGFRMFEPSEPWGLPRSLYWKCKL